MPGTVDSNHDVDIYVRDLAGGTTSLVTENAVHNDAVGGVSSNMRFSPTGPRLAFDGSGTGLGPADTNGDLDVYLATLHRADLTVTLDAEPSPATSGRALTYTVDVANQGDAADGTTVLVGMPDGTDGFGVSTSAIPCTLGAGSRVFVCAVGSLPAGGSARIVVTALVTAPAGGTLTAGALVSTSTAELDRGDNVAVVETPVTG